jgi:hypothetical protein
MTDEEAPAITNGAGGAAVLAAAAGCFALSILALVGDASPRVAVMLKFWPPTGPLSGVTDIAIVIWLALWFVLSRLWASRSVSLKRVNAMSLILLVLAILLTFPPIMDFLQGK